VKNIPKDEWQQHSVQEVLAKCSADNTIGVDTDAVKVLGLMRRTGNSRLMVLENGQLAGVVSLKDLLHFLSIKVDLENNGKHDNLPHDQFTKLGS
jgi:signal-transduction protein with cAMP-binding, CBS, and nucleotidyltransferase domain